MKKKTAFRLLCVWALLAALLIAGCGLAEQVSGPSEVMAEPLEEFESLPDIRVFYGADDTEIPSASGDVSWIEEKEDGNQVSTIACGPDPIQYLVQRKEEFPYLAFHTTIKVEFDHPVLPDKVVVYDVIVNDDGQGEYSEDAAMKTEYHPDSSTLELKVDASQKNGQGTPPEEGETILRGFKLVCSWENGSKAEYGFLIRTDE